MSITRTMILGNTAHRKCHGKVVGDFETESNWFQPRGSLLVAVTVHLTGLEPCSPMQALPPAPESLYMFSLSVSSVTCTSFVYHQLLRAFSVEESHGHKSPLIDSKPNKHIPDCAKS